MISLMNESEPEIDLSVILMIIIKVICSFDKDTDTEAQRSLRSS